MMMEYPFEYSKLTLGRVYDLIYSDQIDLSDLLEVPDDDELENGETALLDDDDELEDGNEPEYLSADDYDALNDLLGD
jgi:hypothetical protein